MASTLAPKVTILPSPAPLTLAFVQPPPCGTPRSRGCCSPPWAQWRAEPLCWTLGASSSTRRTGPQTSGCPRRRPHSRSRCVPRHMRRAVLRRGVCHTSFLTPHARHTHTPRRRPRSCPTATGRTWSGHGTTVRASVRLLLDRCWWPHGFPTGCHAPGVDAAFSSLIRECSKRGW